MEVGHISQIGKEDMQGRNKQKPHGKGLGVLIDAVYYRWPLSFQPVVHIQAYKKVDRSQNKISFKSAI